MTSRRVMGHELPLFVVDAFTKNPFSGNPAAVCLVTTSQDVSDETKQRLASEMNLSETAFVTRLNAEDSFDKSTRFGLRWFTPACEVNLCGHATLATAAALFHAHGNSNEALYFETLSGTLIARRQGERIGLDMPLNPPEPLTEMDEMLEGLIRVVAGSLPVHEVLYSPTMKKLMIRVKDSVTREDLESSNPPPQLMLHAHNTGFVGGVILTVKGTKANGAVNEQGQIYDFLSRYFAPWKGINEDPVTGSAHTVLGPYWAKELNKRELFARQCSKRGGELWVSVREDGRVDVSGQAAILIRGTVQVEEFEATSPPGQLMLHAHNTGFIGGVILTVKGTKENGSVNEQGETYDFLSRFFAPWKGVNEDPVCGSAHTVLGPYWAKELDKKDMFARQSSKRGGELWVSIGDDGRTHVSGHAAILIRGTVQL